MPYYPFKENFLEAQKILDAFISDVLTWEKLEMAGEIISHSIKSGNKIISCGNGGSLCDAMHFAEELTGRFHHNRRPLPAIAISDPSHITCIANDFGFDYIFSRTVEAIGKPGDVLLAISTSGNSQNIVNAIEAARSKSMNVVALTGRTGGTIGPMCDVEIRVPYNGYPDRIQEIHIKIIHSLINYLEFKLKNDLFNDSNNVIL